MEQDDGEEEGEDVLLDTMNLTVPQLEMSGVTSTTHTLSHTSGKVCVNYFAHILIGLLLYSISCRVNVCRNYFSNKAPV